jgi:FtsZ-binding cell division protein ZapB
MVELDLTLKGAVKEIHRLCDRITELESDNKFLTERLMALGRERNALRREVERLKDADFNEALIRAEFGE